MRRFFIYLSLFLCSIGFCSGQYYKQDQGLLVGINGGYLYPTGDMGKILKNGLGGSLSLKYLINRVIGIGFEGGYYSFKNKLNLDNENAAQDYKCRVIPALLETTFYIPTWDRTLLPYAGLQFGAYMTNINVSRKEQYAQNAISKKRFLFSPGAGIHAGLLFEISDRLWIDVKLRGDYVPKIEDEYDLDEYTKGNIGFNKMLNIGGNIGIFFKW